MTTLSSIKNILIGNYYHVEEAYNLESARTILAHNQIDLILLDKLLPDGDGFALQKWITNELTPKKPPVIMMTGVNDDMEQIIAYELGVLDYIIKPFSPRLLLAKIRSFFANYNKIDQGSITHDNIYFFGYWKFNFKSLELIDTSNENNTFLLSFSEAKLLKVFIEQAGKILSKEFLCPVVYGREHHYDDTSLNVLIYRLRQKLSSCRKEPDKQFIKTVHSSGYIFLGMMKNHSVENDLSPTNDKIT